MALVGTIAANLTAGTAMFEAGVNKAKGLVGGLASSLGSIGKIGVGVALGNSLSGMASQFKAMTVGQFDVIDKNAKMADSLGMSSEALAAMQLNANLAGVGAEELGANLGRLEKGLGEAVNGGGPLAETLDMLGMSANDLASIPLEDAIGKIGTAINGLENPAQRAKVATELFGKADIRMLPMLAAGKEGLAQAAEEAKKFGIAISRADAAKVEAANDAITRSGVALQGVAQQIAIGIAPVIEASANKFTEWAVNARNGGMSILPSIEAVAQGLRIVGDVVDTVILGFYALQYGVTAVISGIVSGLDKLISAIKEVAEFVGIDMGETDFLKTFSDELDKKLEDIGAKMKEKLAAKSTGDKLADMFKQISKAAEDAAKKIDEASKKTGQFNKALIKPGKFAIDPAKDMGFAMEKELMTPLEKFEDRIQGLRDLMEFEIIKPETFERGVKDARDELEKSLNFKPLGKGGTFAEIGSQEALRILNPRENTQQRTLQDILNEGRKQTSELKTIAGKVAGELAVANF